MDPIIVLEAEGKRDSLDFIKVLLFDNLEDAEDYCINNTTAGKYWKSAQIVHPGWRYDRSDFKPIEV